MLLATSIIIWPDTKRHRLYDGCCKLAITYHVIEHAAAGVASYKAASVEKSTTTNKHSRTLIILIQPNTIVIIIDYLFCSDHYIVFGVGVFQSWVSISFYHVTFWTSLVTGSWQYPNYSILFTALEHSI